MPLIAPRRISIHRSARSKSGERDQRHQTRGCEARHLAPVAKRGGRSPDEEVSDHRAGAPDDCREHDDAKRIELGPYAGEAAAETDGRRGEVQDDVRRNPFRSPRISVCSDGSDYGFGGAVGATTVVISPLSTS